MARLFIFLNNFFILIATTTSLATHITKPNPRSKQQKSQTFVFPIFRDTVTSLHYTTVTVGEPPLVVNLGVDVTSSSLWFNCDKIGYNSTTSTSILCGSNKCKQIGGRCTTCDGPYTCRNDTCTTRADTLLLEDNVILSVVGAPNKLVARMPIGCMPPWVAVAGLPFGSQGVLGLASSSSMSFLNRLVSSYKIPFKVTLCLPSNHRRNHSGIVYIGDGKYRKDVLDLFVSTPLFKHVRWNLEEEYFIDVKSMEVNGKTLSLYQDLLTYNKTTDQGGTKINIGIPYTILEGSIYRALVKAFAGNAKKEKAVDPFSDCFSAESFARKKTPVISLVLGGGVKWKLYGSNSLVKVSKNVVCLGFMDMGVNPRVSIEIGGYQMQDSLVEFDLESSKFSFTSSLLLHNTSCSRL